MGNLMREYWMPAIRSDELPSPDCPPVRIKLLGEELIGYRTTSGAVGLMQNACPHRGASLFFGRNEEEGLRCVYHGWKFDVTGACVDMPSEPAESNFKNKVHARAYPTHERNGIIWAYMGPREVPPPLPDIEANMLAAGAAPGQRPLPRLQLDAGPRRRDGHRPRRLPALRRHEVRGHSSRAPSTTTTTAARRQVLTMETDYGTANGAYRPAEEDTYYWRVTQILFPFYHMIPGGELGRRHPHRRLRADG